MTFKIQNVANRDVGYVTIEQGEAYLTFDTGVIFGREDLRAIAHRLMNIADFDTGLRE